MPKPSHHPRRFRTFRSSLITRKLQYLIPITVFLLVASLSVHFLFQSHAATPFSSREAKKSPLTGNSATVSDSNSLGSKAIKFIIATPSSPCLSGPKNAPGTPDPWGGCWPGPNNTGVPAGTKLTDVPGTITSGTGWAWNSAWDGIMVTRCGVTISNLNIAGGLYIRTGNGTTSASTPCVTVKDSKINGYTDDSDACLVTRCGPLVLKDDTISTVAVDTANLVYDNWFAWRINDEGGNGLTHCNGTCETHDSWLHGLVPQRGFHMNAEGSNGMGAGNYWIIDHNYEDCGNFSQILSNVDYNNAGCSADIGFYGDYKTLNNITITHNYFAPAVNTQPLTLEPSYCLNTGMGSTKPYPTVTHETVKDNVFARGYTGKCGVYGPVGGWDPSAAADHNVWSGNVWDDGTVLGPPSVAGS